MGSEVFLEIPVYSDRVMARRRADGRSVILPFTPELEQSRVFGQRVRALKASATILATAAPNIIRNLSPRGWNERFKEREGVPLFRATRDLHKATLNQNEELGNWRRDMRKPLSPLDPAIAAEIRAWLRGLKTGEAARAALESPQVAEATLGGYFLTGLPDTMKTQIEESLIRHNLVERYGKVFTLKPDASNLLASGPDRDAAERAAQEGIANHEAARAEVGNVEVVLNSVIDWISVVGDVTRSDAFQLVQEA